MTTGTIKKVVADRGFGFIAAEDAKEYFFHRGGLDSTLDFDRLMGGEKVEFEIEQSPKGPRASQVARGLAARRPATRGSPHRAGRDATFVAPGPALDIASARGRRSFLVTADADARAGDSSSFELHSSRPTCPAAAGSRRSPATSMRRPPGSEIAVLHPDRPGTALPRRGPPPDPQGRAR